MAYDYDVDILGALFTGGEENQEPYVSFISENGALTNEVSERRILSSIELLRSHMELIQTRDEANLLMYALARLITHTAGGSNPFSSASAKTEAIGNVKNPQFPAGANVAITFDGTTIPATSASGGECAEVVAELNAFLDVPGTPVPEMSTVLVTVGDAEGSLGSKFFTLNSANDATNYYVWMEHGTRPESTEITVSGDTDGDLAGTRFTINGTGDVGSPEEYYVWYSHDGIEEETEVTVMSDTDGNRAGLYFTLNSPTAAFYVWYSHDGIGETTDITLSADVNGSHEEEYFLINSPTAEFHVWYSHDGSSEITSVGPNADISGSLAGTSFHINTAGDGTLNYVFFTHDGLGESISLDFIGIDGAALAIGAVPAAFFDIDSTTTAYRIWFADGTTTMPAAGGRTLVASAFTGADTDIVVAGKLVTALVVTSGDADFAGFVNGGTAIVTGTLGSVGNVTDPVDGTTATGATIASTTQGAAVDESDPAPGGGRIGIEVAYAVNDGAVTLGGLIQTALDSAEGYAAEGNDPVLVVNDSIGVTTNSVDVDTGFAISTTQEGLAVAETDPSPTANGLEVMYVVNASADSLAEGTVAVVDGDAAFGADDSAPGVVTIDNVAVGPTTDAEGGTVGFGVLVTQQGLDIAETDPAPAGEGIEIEYAVDDNSDDLGLKTATGVGLNAAFSAVDNSEGEITVTNTAIGIATDATAGTSEWGISVTQQGLDASETDPAPAEGTGLEVAYSVDAIASSIAEGTTAAIDSAEGIGAVEGGGALTITTTAEGGSVVDAADVDTGFAFDVTTQGLDSPPDPAPFGLTGISVSYTVGGDVTQGAEPSVIAAAIASAVDANGDFDVIAEGATVFADNAADGPTTDLTDGDTGFVFTVTQQGADASDTIPVEAFCTLDGRLGFRSEVDFLSFSIANGTGGIIGPAGIIPGPRLSTPARVANDGRNAATNYVSKKKRNNPLDG